MFVCYWFVVFLVLVVFCGFVGCSGNYKFNDGDYCLFGDLQVVNCGK